jgi:hypothetical protein
MTEEYCHTLDPYRLLHVNQRPNLTRCQRVILTRVRGRICAVFMVVGIVPDFEDVAVVVYAEHSRALQVPPGQIPVG